MVTGDIGRNLFVATEERRKGPKVEEAPPNGGNLREFLVELSEDVTVAKIKELMEKYPTYNLEDSIGLVEGPACWSYQWRHIFEVVIAAKDLAVARYVLDQAPKILGRGSNESFLAQAAYGSPLILWEMLKRGAPVNLQNSDGRTTLEEICHRIDIRIEPYPDEWIISMALLICKGAKIQSCWCRPKVTEAVEKALAHAKVCMANYKEYAEMITSFSMLQNGDYGQPTHKLGIHALPQSVQKRIYEYLAEHDYIDTDRDNPPYRLAQRRIEVVFDVGMGNFVGICGEKSLWSKVIPCRWNPGNRWRSPLVDYKCGEYKIVYVGKEGETHWEKGDNRKGWPRAPISMTRADFD